MNIQKIITSYVASPETNGSILISGPWGIGKSFYWRNTLKPAIEKIPVANKSKKYKCLYVSLNGVSDTQEILNQLLLEKIPVLKNKFVKVSGDLAPNVFKEAASWIGFSKVGNAFSRFWGWLKGIKFDEFMSFEDCVICFDDLERNNVQEKILGFINTYFVEKRNCKVILIGDESKINQEGSPYHKIKEKLIFRIVQFDPGLVGLQDLMKKYEDELFRKVLSKHADYLSHLQKETSNRNLRTWIFILDCLNQIFTQVPSLGKDENSELAKSTIFFTVLISIDFKAGVLHSHEADDFKGLERLMPNQYHQLVSESFAKHRRNQQQEGDDEKIAAKYEMAFYERNHIRNHEEYFFFPAIYKFVLTGEFDVIIYHNDVKSFEEFLQNRDRDKTSERISLQAMRQANWIKTDDELNQHYQTFLSHISAGDYPFYDYGWMYDITVTWIDDKLLQGDKHQLENIFVEGCNNALKRGEHQLPFISRDENARYTTTKSSQLGKIITAGIYNLEQVDEQNKQQEYVDAIKSDSVYFKDRYYYTDPFLYLNPKQLFELVTNELQAFNNLNRYLTKQLDNEHIGLTYKYEVELAEFHEKLKQWYTPDGSGVFIYIAKLVLWQCAELEKRIAHAKQKSE